MRSKQLYRFGAYTLDAEERVLLRDGQPVTLPPKDLETLLVLVERAGHIVDKDELLKRVWPGVFIEEGNLSRRIFNLRQALGDAPDGRPFIETIPKRGYRFTAIEPQSEEAAENGSESIPIPQSPHVQRNQLFRFWPLAISALLLLSAILVSGYLRPAHPPSQRKVMLAVLPFQNLSGDDHEEYFADGLTEEMIAQLGQLQPSQLGVIARTSTSRYKSTKETAAQIGRDLGVEYLLEGSVRRGGDRVRITAQLIQASEQTHMWAETYERPVTDVLTIQSEIAERITRSLSLQLLPAQTNSSASPVNYPSYDKYLLGRHDLGEGTQASINQAVQHFQEAITENPNDARLYAALGEAYEALITYYSSPAEMMPRVKAAAMQAIQLDPNLAGAHVLLGDVHLFFDWDWSAAEAEYRRALAINPSLPQAQLGYAAYLGTLGRFDEALAYVQQAYLSDPLAIDSRHDALWIYYFSGRMQETVDQAQRAIEIEPSSGLPYAMLAMANANMGKRTEAIQAAEQAIAKANSPSVLTTAAWGLAHVGQTERATKVLAQALAQAKERYVCRFLVAATYVELGDRAEAFDSLEQGFLQRST